MKARKSILTALWLFPFLGLVLLCTSLVYGVVWMGVVGVAIITVTIAGVAVALIAAPIIGIWSGPDSKFWVKR
jgi:hypothetical protein